MKFTDLKVGLTYWYSTSNDWDQYDGRSYHRHPVQVEDLTRYRYRPPAYSIPKGWTPDRSAHKDPKGGFVRVIVPGDLESRYPSDRVDRVAYVQPRYIRAELEEFKALVKRNREARQAAQAEA